MSCHYHVFLGPYLEVHNPVQDTTIKRQSCPNNQCSNHRKLVESPFCPKCGQRTCHINVPTRGRKEFNIYNEFKQERLLEITHEGMEDENYMRFQSNIRDCAGRTFYDSTEVISMDHNTPNAEIEQFSKAFEKEITRIVDVFGPNAVKIKWGAISYWS